MSLSIFSSTSPLLNALQAKGLSAGKASLVEDEVVDAVAEVVGASPAPNMAVDMATLRASLDKRIDADVASGKLSAQDAAAVKKTLDDVGQVMVVDGEDEDGETPQADAPRGGGGAPAEDSKTELSSSVTVSGNIKTTLTTYTDGTSDSKTSVASDADMKRYAKAAAAYAPPPETAQSYLASIEPGTLFSIAA